MKKRERRKLYFFIATLFIVGIIFLLIPPDNTPELKLRDFRMRIRGIETPAAPVLIVAVDDYSFEELNMRWPWRRSVFAEVLERIDAGGASVVGFDIMLSENDYYPGDDVHLADAFQAHGSVVLPMKFERLRAGPAVSVYAELPLPEYMNAAADLGAVNLVQDRDGRVRSLPPVMTIDGERFKPFAAAVAARYYEGSRPANPVPGGEPAPAAVPFAAAAAVAINFIGGAGTFPFISIADVLQGNYPEGVFKDRIVLIGAAFAESHDNYAVPFTGLNGELMYGVEVHAHGINTLLTETIPQPLSPLISFVLFFFILLTATFSGYYLKPAFGLTAAAASLLIYSAAAVLIFIRATLFLPLFKPLAASVISYIVSLVYRYFVEIREKQAVRALFSKYVSPQVVEKVLQSEEKLRLGGELREVVLFFSDIRGFTAMSEKLEPPVIVSMLNRYFDSMGEIIYKYEGTLNKFIGDAIMAFYGAPIPQDDAPRRAVYAALDMRRELEQLNTRFESDGLPSISIGMGLHTGPVLVGNIGSSRQVEYTVIGDAVNLCSRIESLTKEFGHDILISDELYRKVSSDISVETPDAVPVKGKSGLIQVHKVLGKK